ncbi:lipase/esterase [Cladophialophora carrionii]|uniref:Lipase/esterase n=1 Tax=Cladophialophora carrionii TaxID=86049 RepID=A0A1C1CCY6_9EURO|nr:lipase/esterase [Cladophialophora carrionii]
MTITTLAVGAAVTPTVVKTYISHYANRKERREKPTAHISYDEGLHLIRTFLKYASHHTVEDLQSFTGQWVPSPSWVRTENVTVPDDYLAKAARTITNQLGAAGVESVGGTRWWQWRPRGGELKAEWIEMRAHYNEQKRQGSKSRRIMLYIHGGGYFFGSVDEHRYQMQRHARKLKARVFAPRYRLAPQFPFPSGLQDCLAAYLYLLDMHDPSEIILAGDSAGGGMIVSILCMLRDQALPLPAGAILISPWVDLSHSFPSLSGNAELDYIPPYGFMQKPSAAWPPPNDEEVATISRLAKGDDGLLPVAQDEQKPTTVPDDDGGGVKPGPQLSLSIELDGKRVVLKDQIQMYTTNQLLAHPLVSPVLQPSLGGLPPVLILTGGGEILRDEQIYLAHKMANPPKYPLGAAYRSRYDPDDTMLNKYKPTPVMLQVWDDLCHVAPTLSFTRPAKFMYRSIAQFGAWVLAKAQKRAIDIVDDDNISIISSQTDTGSTTDAEVASPADSISRVKIDANKTTGSVGRAGDPIPPFANNMIRQRIDRYGRIYPLADPHDLPALQLHPDDVGVIKPGPVRKWLEAKASWDAKYASTRKRVQKERVKALASGKIMGFEAGEHPPPSALAGRRTDKDIMTIKKRKSYGLAMWSGWGSKHDESTLKREEGAVEAGQSIDEPPGLASEQDKDTKTPRQPIGTDGQVETSSAEVTAAKRAQSRKRSSSMKRTTSESRTRGRKRTISVTDRGQTEGRFVPAIVPPQHAMSSTESPEAMKSQIVPHAERATSPIGSLLSSGFLPKFKTASHLRDDSGGSPQQMPILSDAASTMTGRSGIFADDASTTAVFAAPGVMKSADTQQAEPGQIPHPTTARRPQSPLVNEATSVNSDGEDVDEGVASGAPSVMSRPHTSLAGFGSDSPRSQRSLDRLQSHQLDEGMGRLAPLRSTSSTAVVRAEGVVSVVDSTLDGTRHHIADQDEKNNDSLGRLIEPTDNLDKEGSNQDVAHRVEKSEPNRPKMYDRAETDFQTAFEKI